MLKSERLQAWQQSRAYCFMLFVFQRFMEVRVPQIAASLTYTTLLALVPILTVTLVIVSAFPMFSDLSADFIQFINMMLVPSGVDVILDYINQFKAKASNLTAIGVIFLMISSLMLVQTIDQTFNRIWRVNTQRPWWMQLLVYWALLTFAPLVLGVSISVWGLMLQSSRLDVYFPFLADALRIGTSLLFNTILLWLLYRCLLLLQFSA